jgi:hypothetical protein
MTARRSAHALPQQGLTRNASRAYSRTGQRSLSGINASDYGDARSRIDQISISKAPVWFVNVFWKDWQCWSPEGGLLLLMQGSVMLEDYDVAQRHQGAAGASGDDVTPADVAACCG